MNIKLYNTLTRQKEPFEPVQTGKVLMYVCGPTVYDDCHIGHARSVIVFDVISRYLSHVGYDVTYIRNFTDIDDKIIMRANEKQLDANDLAKQYIQAFYRDMDQLKVERPTKEPKATDHIPHIIQFIQKLINKGHAYDVQGDVYFSVDSFPTYGRLSGRKIDELEAGARVKIDDKKHSPHDFALWKSAKPQEPFWESPWGKGRPGWHIECSAMSMAYLGETFDIHGGGKDLIFPHHENEIAQSEAATGKPYVKYWLHNGFVNIQNEKMSKSTGNFLLIKDMLNTYHPETIRLFLLSKHYRSPIDFTEHYMQESKINLDKLYTLMDRLNQISESKPQPSNESSYRCRFNDAMNDDFNTAQGIGIMFEYVRTINRLLDNPSERMSQDEALLAQALPDMHYMADILGILQESPKDYFEHQTSGHLEKKGIDPKYIDQLIIDRTDARKSKNWKKADAIRDELAQLGVILEDRPDGTIWHIQDNQ